MSETKTCPKCGADLPDNAPSEICPKCLMRAGVQSDSAAEMNPTTLTSGFVPPDPQDLAKHFPQLEILELLGKGGMGAVYKARQPGLDRLVAVKILPPEIGADPAFAERFAREARALARLSHQNIVSVFDFGQVDGPFYFVMEFVDGTNLRQLIEAGGLKPEEALAIVPQICEALQFAHNEGIVHRDVKPENILIDKRGRVKIADFGLAKILGRPPGAFTLTGSQQVMGTVRYMAPEQMEGARAVDHRADIYSLGVVFYEMLTGELPLGRFAPPSEKVQIDVRLDEVVLRSLEKEPQRRYQQASEVKTDVEKISRSPQPQPTTTPSGPPDADVDAARDQVRGPAIGLLIAGIIHCLVFGLLLLPFGLLAGRLLLLLVLITELAPGVAMIIGAFRMLRLQSYQWAMAASVIALLPCSPASLLGLVMGIWSLIVLNRREVRAAFEAHPRLRAALTESGTTAGLQRPTPAPAVEPASRLGFPVVVVVLVAAGVGLFVCVGILTALLFPAVSAAREAARRSACGNNLKQISLAMLQYQNAHGTFPPAYIPDENGRPKHSWRVLLLPYLEAQHIYDQYNFDEPWDGPNNSRLANQMPSVYLCPSDSDSVNQSFTSYAAVTGPGTMFEGSQAVSMSAIRDGQSMTMAVVEAAGTDINWMEPRDLDLSQAGYVVNGQAGGMESRHPGGAQAVFVDGSVHFLPASISPQELQALTTISGGEPVAVP